VTNAAPGVGVNPGYLDREDLRTLLGSKYQVPDYQRGYAWAEDNIADYIGDLRDHYASAASGRSFDAYFFGAVVTIRRSTGLGRADRVLEVVDGQQRLTTFFVTLGELRRAAAEVVTELGHSRSKAKTAAQGLVADMGSYLFEPGTTTVRMFPGGTDPDYFQRLIADGASEPAKTDPDSHQNLYKAADAIRTNLIGELLEEGSTPQERSKILDRMATAFLSQCYVIHAGSEVELDAFRLFLVLNDRGLELTEADLLRTRTFDLLRDHPSEQERAKKAWKAIVEAKPGVKKGFLRAYWSLQIGRRPKSKDLHRQYQDEWFAERPKNRDAAGEMADRIEDMGKVFGRYVKITNGEWPIDGGTANDWEKDRLKRLIKTLGSDASIPLLLGLSYGSERRFRDVVLFLERFVFRYNLSGGHKSSLGDRLFEAAKLGAVDQGWTLASLEKALAGLVSKYADDARFAAALAALRYRGSRVQVKHLLTTLDDYYAWYRRGSRGAPRTTKVSVFVLDQGDIDHIYPQSPEPGADDSRLEPVKDYLGNLAFLDLGDNRSIKNAPFDRKQREVYATAAPQLTKDLGDRKRWKTWDIKAYNRRRDDLVEMARKVFNVPGAA
jgi:hypothetical protein